MLFLKIAMDFSSDIPQNTVQYYLYHQESFTKQQLNDLIRNYFDFLKPYLNQYIWHNETFNLNSFVNNSGLYIFL